MKRHAMIRIKICNYFLWNRLIFCDDEGCLDKDDLHSFAFSTLFFKFKTIFQFSWYIFH